jgi:hypothetical protein
VMIGDGGKGGLIDGTEIIDQSMWDGLKIF